MSGDIAFFGSGRTLVVVDLSNRASPVVLAELVLPDAILDIAVRGEYAYVTARLGGLRIIDVSDPEEPFEVGWAEARFWAAEVAIAGDLAYVAAGDLFWLPSPLTVIDISDPTAPFEVAYTYAMLALSVSAAGHDVCIATGDSLRIFNYTWPEYPWEVGSVTIPYPGVLLVEVADSFAYIAGFEGGLRVIDIDDPMNPIVVGSVETAGRHLDLAVSDGVAHLLDGESVLRVIDISSPTAPREVATFGETDGRYRGGAVAASGDTVMVADPANGLRVIDVSSLEDPLQVSMLPTPGSLEAVEVQRNYAYVSDYYGGLHVFDVSAPERPVEVGSVDFPGWTGDVTVSGDFAYVGVEGGVRVIDVSDPENPAVVGFAELSESPFVQEVQVRGRFAYAAGGWGGGFSVIDISIPENPLEVGWIGQRRVLGLDVVGSYAYLAQYSDDRSNGHLRVVDVSIPEDPVVVGLFEVSLCHADDVVVVGNRAFLETCHGLRVIDVADPTNPVESEWIDLNSVDSLTISKGVGYFVDRMGHLCALDLSEPSSPTELGISQIIEAGDDIDLVGDLAYVVGSNGLEIFDVSGCKAARPISPMPRRARGLSLPSSGGE